MTSSADRIATSQQQIAHSLDRIASSQEQITRSLDHLTADQEQMTREITKLQEIEQSTSPRPVTSAPKALPRPAVFAPKALPRPASARATQPLSQASQEPPAAPPLFRGPSQEPVVR
jgi:methyl-accepting chemotaxis protein